MGAFIRSVAVFMAWPALVALAHAVPKDGPEALSALVEAYRGVEGVSLRAVTPAGDANQHAFELHIASDGQFAARYFSKSTPVANRPWDERPYYFVYFDGKTMHVARDQGNVFEDHDAGRALDRSPGPVQFLYAPWPVIPMFARWLQSFEDTVYERLASGWRASSIRAGLTLEWSDQSELVRIRRHIDPGGVTQEMSFTSFQSVEGFSLPTFMHEVIKTGVIRDGREVGADATYQVSSMRVNPPDLGSSLRFDSMKLQVSRFDAASKNVYGPDGSLLYNEDQVLGVSTPTWIERLKSNWVLTSLLTLLVVVSALAARNRFSAPRRTP